MMTSQSCGNVEYIYHWQQRSFTKRYKLCQIFWSVKMGQWNEDIISLNNKISFFDNSCIVINTA